MPVLLALGGINLALFVYVVLPWKALYLLIMASCFIGLEIVLTFRKIRSIGLLSYCPSWLQTWFIDYSPLEFLTDPLAADYFALYLPFMLNPNEGELKRALRRLPYEQQQVLLQQRLVDVLPGSTRSLLLGTKAGTIPKVRPSTHVQKFLKKSKQEEVVRKTRNSAIGKELVFDASQPDDPNLAMDILFHNKYYAVLEDVMKYIGLRRLSKNAILSMCTAFTTVTLYLYYFRRHGDTMIRKLARYLLSFGSLGSIVLLYFKLKGIGSSSDDNYNLRDRLNAEEKPFQLKGFKLFKKFIHGR
eukprot:g12514.t1